MDAIREHLVRQLQGGLAYDTFESIVGEFSPNERGRIPEGAEHSPWQILEHMRISLRDILDFTQNEDGSYRERDWPAEYWPTEALGDWEGTINSYQADLKEMESLVSDLNRDLAAVFPWGEGQSLLREALLAADHAAYHLGELVELKRWIAQEA